jgi:hypothetical protein
LSGILSVGLGNADAHESGVAGSPSAAGIAATTIEPLVLAFVEEGKEADKPAEPAETQPVSENRRSGLTAFQEKTLIVVIAIVIAFVVAWILAGRSQEEIQRILNRSKGSTASDESGQKTETELSTEQPQEVKSDTVPEIPAVSGEDTDHDLPVSDDR